MNKLLLILLTLLTGFHTTDSKESVQIMEGFYQSGWECSIFYELRDRKVYSPQWLVFNASCELSDSITNIFEKTALNDFYIKVEAIKTEGGDYGHLGAYKKEIEVFRILEIDTTYSLQNALRKRRTTNAVDKN